MAMFNQSKASLLLDLDIMEKPKHHIISEGRSLYGHKFPGHTHDVIIDRTMGKTPASQHRVAYRARLIVYLPLTLVSYWTTVHTNKDNYDFENPVQALASLLDSLWTLGGVKREKLAVGDEFFGKG